MFQQTFSCYTSPELTLKMAAAGFVEVLENTQHSLWPSPESQRHAHLSFSQDCHGFVL
jgi:hypothetical protein